jgi:hypothetical protein
MPRIHTHYDNLKVARNAPPEVIRAAYRTLSQRFHPDRNPDDAEAARIMTIINSSYEVLSNPAKRRVHDQWIAEQERRAPDVDASPRKEAPSGFAPHASRQSPSLARTGLVTAHFKSYWPLYLFGWVIGYSAFFDKPSPPPPGPKPYQVTPPTPPSKPTWVRPETAPNGQPWPTMAAYVTGYQQLHTGGLSSVTVDNSRNDSDVFVKLVSLDGAQAYPARQFFIPAQSTFTALKVKAGRYDVRYRNLTSGALSRSEAFELEETPSQNGTEYSKITMTLYKVQHGNMQTYRLAEQEF